MTFFLIISRRSWRHEGKSIDDGPLVTHSSLHRHWFPYGRSMLRPSKVLHSLSSRSHGKSSLHSLSSHSATENHKSPMGQSQDWHIWNISGNTGLVSAGRIYKDTPPLTTPGHTSKSSAMDTSSHIFQIEIHRAPQRRFRPRVYPCPM